jgi:hypothetical protein
MDALVAFYSSPVGQKFVMEQPAIAAESLQASSDILKKFADQMRQQLNDQLAQMQQVQKGTESQPDPH